MTMKMSEQEWLDAIMTARDQARVLVKQPEKYAALNDTIKTLKQLLHDAPATADGEPNMLQREIMAKIPGFEDALEAAIEKAGRVKDEPQQATPFLLVSISELEAAYAKGDVKGVLLAIVSPIEATGKTLFSKMAEALLAAKDTIEAKGKGLFVLINSARDTKKTPTTVQLTQAQISEKLEINGANFVFDEKSVPACAKGLENFIFSQMIPVDNQVEIEIKAFSPAHLKTLQQAAILLQTKYQDPEQTKPHPNIGNYLDQIMTKSTALLTKSSSVSTDNVDVGQEKLNTSSIRA